MSSKDLNNQSSEEQKSFLKKAKEKEIQNPWAAEIKRNQDLWAKYGITVDTNLPMPEFKSGYRLEFAPASLTETGLVKIYDKEFKNLASNSYSQDPTYIIKNPQPRPQGNYWFIWNPTIEPDTNHLNKSYNDFKNDGHQYMVPKEGIIAALTYRIETGSMLDIKGWTFFHATHVYGNVLFMSRDSVGGFFIGYGDPDGRGSDGGPRQVFL